MVQGLIHDISTCQQLIDRIIAEADAIVDQRLAAMLAKWPVLAEEWARGIEHRRTHPEAPGGMPAARATGAEAVEAHRRADGGS